jgi:serine/threonine-protein kinase
MTQLAEQLQGALGSAYRVERELGGGGMSRVFLARETALDRSVVIKVLPPDLSRVLSDARFTREIQVAAGLQHPLVVPLHTAGIAEGLRYYTMPFVSGESLRARLEREGTLPPRDAARILRDVAEALAHAHTASVIHRDIKPENILLSGDHALVTDFGVAKALVEAVPNEVLTSTGLAVGTPPYMAPEQAAGDPAVDHRTDIYALGVVGYELLAGARPYRGRTPIEVLAQQMSGPPAPLGASVPARLAATIARCLEPQADRRWQSVAELYQELDAIVVGLSGGGDAHAARSQRGLRWVLGAAAIVALTVTLTRWAGSPGRSSRLDPELVAALPFEIAAPDLTFMREGIVDLLAAKLGGEHGLRTTHPDLTIGAWRRRGGDRQALSRRDGLRLAGELGAGRLLLGAIADSAGSARFEGEILEVPNGRVVARGVVSGAPGEAPALIDGLVAKLLAVGAGEAEQRLPSLAGIPLDAVKSYLDGRAAYRRAQYGEAAQAFLTAIERDSTFALAALALYECHARSGAFFPGFERAFGVIYASKDRLGRRDRLLVDAFFGPRDPLPQSAAERLAARERAAEAIPDQPEVWAYLGDSYYHFGWLLGFPDAMDRASAAYRRAVALDSTFSGPLARLLEIAAFQGDAAEVRRLASRLQATGTGFSVARRWLVATVLGSRSTRDSILGQLDSLPAAGLISLANYAQFTGIGLEDLKRFVAAMERRAGNATQRPRLTTPLAAALLNTGRPDAARRILATASPDLHWEQAAVVLALAGDGDRGAAAAAERRLRPFLEPPVAEDWNGRHPQNDAACAVALAAADRGDAPLAGRALGRLRAPAVWADTSWLTAEGRFCAETAEALLAARVGAPDALTRRLALDSAMRTGPPLYDLGTSGGSAPTNLLLAELYTEAGDTLRALSVVRRRPFNWFNPVLLTSNLLMEGRLAAATGDTAGAARAYRHYLGLRSQPEPPLVAQRDSVARELGDLGRSRTP